MSYAKQRDTNEAEIVLVLRRAGASVTRLSDHGVPDLLVGWQGTTHLLEVKHPLGAKGGARYNKRSKGGDGDLTRAQVAWWAAWRGSPAHVVRSVDEAMRAIRAWL